MEAVSVKKVQNPQSNRICTKLLNATDINADAIIYQISKQMNGPYHFIEYTKCSYLFPCGKNINLIVFLDHGALRSERKEIRSLRVFCDLASFK